MAKSRRTTQVPLEQAQADYWGQMSSGIQHVASNSLLMRDGAAATQPGASLGLPLPSLAVRYGLYADIFPLGRVTVLCGLMGSGKSALLAEMLGWHLWANGFGTVAITEPKDAADLRDAILRRDLGVIQRYRAWTATTMEAWQDMISGVLRQGRALMKDANGARAAVTVPLFCSVDSVMGVGCQEQVEAIMKDGHASRGFAIEAQLITRYMRAVNGLFEGLPVSLVMINHLRVGKDNAGRTAITKPGGGALDFYESLEIRMTKIADIERVPPRGIPIGGLRLLIHFHKNCVGPSHREIMVDLLWQMRPLEGGGLQQDCYWDWLGANVLLYERLRSPTYGSPTLHRRCMEICDITVVDAGNRGKLAWSEALGVPQDSPEEFGVVGYKLEQRPDLLASLYQVLGIQTLPKLDINVNYEDQLAAAARARLGIQETATEE